MEKAIAKGSEGGMALSAPERPGGGRVIAQSITMTSFTKTGVTGTPMAAHRFAKKTVPLDQGTLQSMLSPVFASGGYQLRTSPVGFRSQFHCTGAPQWEASWVGRWRSACKVVSRASSPGEHFYSG